MDLGCDAALLRAQGRGPARSGVRDVRLQRDERRGVGDHGLGRRSRRRRAADPRQPRASRTVARRRGCASVRGGQRGGRLQRQSPQCPLPRPRWLGADRRRRQPATVRGPGPHRGVVPVAEARADRCARRPDGPGPPARRRYHHRPWLELLDPRRRRLRPRQSDADRRQLPAAVRAVDDRGGSPVPAPRLRPQRPHVSRRRAGGLLPRRGHREDRDRAAPGVRAQPGDGRRSAPGQPAGWRGVHRHALPRRPRARRQRDRGRSGAATGARVPPARPDLRTDPGPSGQPSRPAGPGHLGHLAGSARPAHRRPTAISTPARTAGRRTARSARASAWSSRRSMRWPSSCSADTPTAPRPRSSCSRRTP